MYFGGEFVYFLACGTAEVDGCEDSAILCAWYVYSGRAYVQAAVGGVFWTEV